MVKLNRATRATDWMPRRPIKAPVRYLSNGQPIVNPSLWMDRAEGYAKAVEESQRCHARAKNRPCSGLPRLESRGRQDNVPLETLGVFPMTGWPNQPADISDVEAVNRDQDSEQNQGVFNPVAWKVRLHQRKSAAGVVQGVLGVGRALPGGICGGAVASRHLVQAFGFGKTNAD